MDRHLAAKRRAVAAHRSQFTRLIDDDPAGFQLPPELLALAFRPFEVFLAEDPMTDDPNRPASSLPASYFEAIYERDPDPWRFRTSAYERAKYDATLAALPRARYRRALEVGCSIGVLTRDLAPRCDALLAVDAAEKALAAAARRLRRPDQCGVRAAARPRKWPNGGAPFDLILLSEVVYYFDRPDVARLADRVRDTLAPGGDCLLVHWIGDTDYPLSGDDAAECFIEAASGFAMSSGRSGPSATASTCCGREPGQQRRALDTTAEAPRTARRIALAISASRLSAEAGKARRASAGDAASSASHACQNSGAPAGPRDERGRQPKREGEPQTNRLAAPRPPARDGRAADSGTARTHRPPAPAAGRSAQRHPSGGGGACRPCRPPPGRPAGKRR